MRARLISTDGEHLEARVEIDGAVLHVMDEFSPVACGEFLEVELVPTLDEAEPNNEILDGNPGRKRCLERIDGWSYRAFGIICSLSPVTVDCGLLKFEDDEIEVTGIGIGQAIAFTISRLSARSCMQATPAAPAANFDKHTFSVALAADLSESSFHNEDALQQLHAINFVESPYCFIHSHENGNLVLWGDRRQGGALPLAAFSGTRFIELPSEIFAPKLRIGTLFERHKVAARVEFDAFTILIAIDASPAPGIAQQTYFVAADHVSALWP
jgi:hypothetical protein